MTAIEEIKAIRNLLNSPSKFTTGAMARNLEGKIVSPSDNRAVCWCLVGAIKKITPGWAPGTESYYLIRKKLDIPGGFHDTVATWSDTNGYDKVITLLDNIIEEAP